MLMKIKPRGETQKKDLNSFMTKVDNLLFTISVERLIFPARRQFFLINDCILTNKVGSSIKE